MVFLTVARYLRMSYRGPNKGPDEFYRKRNIFRLSAAYTNLEVEEVTLIQTDKEHFYGRARNCYSIAVRKVHRALVYSTKGRKLFREDMRDLWTTRTTAACEELGLPFPLFRQGLQSSDVLLNRKSLSNLAIWEPRTFKALTDFAWKRAEEDGLQGVNSLPADPPSHVVTRQMLKKKK